MIQIGVWAVHKGHIATICPHCKQQICLHEHSIKPGGEIVPGVKCPHEGCNFEGRMQLIGWRLEWNEVKEKT